MSTPEKNLQGKVALVTGASRGLGVAIAHALADRGADIAITYASSAAKADEVVTSLQAKGVRAIAIQTDQGDPTQAAAVIQRVVADLGGLDILVNNAAVAVQGKLVGSPEMDQDHAALDRMWAINVHGVIACIRAAAQVLPEGGRIITIGSGVSSRVGFPGAADYAGTKAAVTGYSKGAARDLGPRKITVNVVQAGLMETEMAAEAGVAEFLFPTLAIQRFGKLEEIAAVATFLASPDASYVTGAVVSAEGGYGA
ncbi:SDR family oxidoreductase [Luteolibacter arcticus]|uniref:SDR family oxidoreductase n=1 Tax=Luteolibacter arcticus TaxID=1581411 RepID=A0ABT3GQL5_9BACT|nr:SDR family oxidoreductase [Luteolibacter arcticus]MCW1925800.1 SDR family oxidoreductase [Luteolibacter arcticus]